MLAVSVGGFLVGCIVVFRYFSLTPVVSLSFFLVSGRRLDII